MPLQIPKVLAVKGRVCRNCSGPIPKPKANNLKRIKFCTDNCRKEFHKNNGISVYKLKVQVQSWVRAEVSGMFDDLAARVAAIEARRRPPKPTEHTITAHPEVHNGRDRIGQ